ncbi:gliding motility-associated C-terminal domain-containing protein [Maribacter sp. X9]|uniref:gliding motility-associated C-terminal domain-containing protein n=1 Tax=Maribacter sp. X9 TaxID=3402159 RepID=UPI003AF39BAB
MILSKRNIAILFFICISTPTLSGQLLRNFGAIEIHTSGELGLFSNVLNEGSFTSKNGLVGFYGDSNLDVTGLNGLDLFDLEIASNSNVFINVPITISNHINFIFGNLETDKFQHLSYLEFREDSFFTGATNFSKVNGTVKCRIKDSFTFPVGDEDYLRPILVTPTIPEALYTCTYFYGNVAELYPFKTNGASSFSLINGNEFWFIEGNQAAVITVNWNQRSTMRSYTDDIKSITMVGFDKTTSSWVNLGSVDTTGNLSEGYISSKPFIPDAYEAITFGYSKKNEENVSDSPRVYNYYISPNADGLNDFLHITELENYDTNVLKIYNRDGLLVFEKENYTNEFDGTSGVNIPSLNRNAGLSKGVYYYLATIKSEKITLQGFLYLDRD